jgi:hypothetical protein
VVDSVVVSVAGVAVAVGADMIVFVVLVSVCVAVAGEGFTIVVLFSVFSGAGDAGATVSVFCSQAAKRAALARMQIYFFIGCCNAVP